MSTLSDIGERFRTALAHARTTRQHDQKLVARQEKVHVVGAGATLTSAYEQFRNAAENTEEHLLLQNAIRRFYRQLFLTRDHAGLATSGDELAVELTLAGYLHNDTITPPQVKQINQLAKQYGELVRGLQGHRVAPNTALSWALDELSVEVERLLSDHGDNDVFMQFCYEYFGTMLDAEKLFDGKIPAEYERALFIAVHRALFRSNNAVIRADLIRRYQVKTTQVVAFSELAKEIDKLLTSPLVEKLYRIVDKQAAPERIVWRMLHDGVELDRLLDGKPQFMRAFDAQVEHEYKQTRDRVSRAIIRAIVFLAITKVIIGLAIEVPYDYWAHGSIVWLPLIVNLVFPPAYMALLSLTLRLPGPANTKALGDRIESVLFTDSRSVQLQSIRHMGGTSNKVFSFVYALFGMLLIGLISWLLITIGFSLLHLAIFFVFLSTASFLGFRLSRMVRELEVVDTRQDGVAFVRDLLYLPFVTIGRWLSETYSQINIVALVLDMVIELPLKTILRLVRQWAVFINAKKDEL